MPNHITNKVKLIGSQQKINGILNAVKYDDGELGTLDFNKLIQMPESLNMTSGSIETTAINAYLSALNPQTEDMGIEKLDIKAFMELCENLSITRYLSSYEGLMTSQQIIESIKYDKDQNFQSIIELGQKYGDNFQKYGYTTWYDWAINNWGTKWNSYDSEPVEENTLTFNTAWARAIPVISKLAEKYSDMDIEYQWADEDIGSNVGRAYYSSGELTEEYIPVSQSKEAYEMAADIIGLDLSECGLKYSKSTGNYEYIEECTNEISQEMG